MIEEKRMFSHASIAVLAAAIMATTAVAEQPMIFGIVGVARSGAPEVATVKAGADVYKIVRDAKGQTVASQAMGRAVEITGTVEKWAGAKWLTVTSCKIIEAVPAASATARKSPSR